jgi:uncharacterized membrane protein YedE/YeeE
LKLLIIFGLFGFAYGVVLQRSGFCIARAGFELFLLKSRDALNGLIAGLLTATIGFAVVSVLRERAGLPPQTHLLISPLGAGTVVGAVIFGLGMTLAGMCAAGTLLRLGEGYVIAWASLAGILLGAACDPFRRFLPLSWQLQSSGLWLGKTVGLPAAAAVTLVAILVTWALIGGKRAFRRRSLLAPTVYGGIALGVLNTLQMAAATPWTVAYPLALIPPAMSGTLSPGDTRAALPLLVLDGGLILGALLARATGERYRLRWPRRTREVVTALAGGVLMGWGIQLARGCSIGGGFSALPSLSASAWVFLPCLFLGAWVGARVVRRLG